MADTTSSHTCTHLVKVSRIKFYASNACGFVGYLLSLLCSRISHIQIFSPRVSVSYVSIIHFELQIENRKFHKYVFSFRVLLQCAFGGWVLFCNAFHYYIGHKDILVEWIQNALRFYDVSIHFPTCTTLYTNHKLTEYSRVSTSCALLIQTCAEQHNYIHYKDISLPLEGGIYFCENAWSYLLCTQNHNLCISTFDFHERDACVLLDDLNRSSCTHKHCNLCFWFPRDDPYET